MGGGETTVTGPGRVEVGTMASGKASEPAAK